MKELKEYFNYYISNKPSQIFEMAYPRKQYKEFFVSDISDQIIENFCLIVYAQTDKNFSKDNVNHWKQELRAQMLRLARLEIKGNSSYETKKKAIEEAWLRDMEFNNYDVVYKTVVVKFDIEGIKNGFDFAILSYINSISKIIELIAKGNEQQIKDYIVKL